MARGIRSRIEGLEADLVGGRCPECGLPPDGPNYTVDRGEELPEDPDEECPPAVVGCGGWSRSRCAAARSASGPSWRMRSNGTASSSRRTAPRSGCRR